MPDLRWITIVGVLGVAVTAPGAQERDGRFLYSAYCVACHGPEARGDGVDADLFSPRPRNLRTDVLDQYTDDALVSASVTAAARARTRPERLRGRAGDTEMLVAHATAADAALAPHRTRAGPTSTGARCLQAVRHHRRRAARRDAPAISRPDYQRRTSDATLLERASRPPWDAAILGLTSENAEALMDYLRLRRQATSTTRFCAACHGDDGRGPGVDRASERRPTIVFDETYFAKKDPEVLRRDVWHMLDASEPQMPHMSRVLRPSEIRSILTFLRVLPRDD
jgi:mono/diheme cytochrome c family protein